MFKVINKIEKGYDLNVTLVFEEQIKICEFLSPENIKLIERLINKKEFTGKKGELLKIDFIERDNLVSMYYVGMGKEEDFNLDVYREVVFDVLSKEKGEVLISGQNEKLLNYNVLGEIASNLNYNFDTFKNKKGEKLEINLFVAEKEIDFSETIALGEATDIARDLVDQPANIINPITLSEKALELGKKYGFEVEILDEKQIEDLGMNLLMAVGRASVTKPRLIVMRYLNGKDNNEKIGLVGKGLTYDTGGLCIKPADSMFEMKSDMAGAASVIGAMCAIANRKVEKNVVAIVPACENAINGNAYRPGDIITSMNGKSVEIINTDAEGRLALADAITYAVRNEKVTEIVDLATLTGAILVALGSLTTGVFSNNDEKYDLLERSSKEYGEKIWRMPLFNEYEDLLKSTVADVKHTGGRMGGSITAAKFLEGFVEGLPWIHMDIAGTAFNSSVKWVKKGATGVGVKTLYSYVKNR
ncbi:leucyl aminopeptidase [Candidatus Cetobacterium colombiensis]|uniref:Probable cytosol aminopeptidase n=1 Tax=Candidatus Cetobacterium colombiensis TaxID=3073100 RepID=A0ABU4W922_9FUSO|nr:leucyl aminopeptidase [Candidatus Cetobacterium colombiensis]MDX8335557.1 leucyl aminopeptidase [Candidatus Cetobacterium colombiensis]